MHILCRFTSLLKLALVAWAVGLAIGFWAGHRVAEASTTSPSANSEAFIPGAAGNGAWRGGEFEWKPTPTSFSWS